MTGVLSQEGTLHDIEGVTGSHNIQLNPYGLSQNERSLINIDPTNPFFSSRHFESTAGGEAKIVLKDSIEDDATINPDFSDVESDQAHFTVNFSSGSASYFPELRPFFLEKCRLLQYAHRSRLHAKYRPSGVRNPRNRKNQPYEYWAVHNRRSSAWRDRRARLTIVG